MKKNVHDDERLNTKEYSLSVAQNNKLIMCVCVCASISFSWCVYNNSFGNAVPQRCNYFNLLYK